MKNSKCSCRNGKYGAKCNHSLFLSSKNFEIANETNCHLEKVKKNIYFISTGKHLQNAEFFNSIHSQKPKDNQENLHSDSVAFEYPENNILTPTFSPDIEK